MKYYTCVYVYIRACIYHLYTFTCMYYIIGAPSAMMTSIAGENTILYICIWYMYMYVHVYVHICMNKQTDTRLLNQIELDFARAHALIFTDAVLTYTFSFCCSTQHTHTRNTYMYRSFIQTQPILPASRRA